MSVSFELIRRFQEVFDIRKILVVPERQEQHNHLQETRSDVFLGRIVATGRIQRIVRCCAERDNLIDTLAGGQGFQQWSMIESITSVMGVDDAYSRGHRKENRTSYAKTTCILDHRFEKSASLLRRHLRAPFGY